MIDVLAFMLLSILGVAAMVYVYYLCEIDMSFENDKRRKNISVTSNRAVNSDSNDVA